MRVTTLAGLAGMLVLVAAWAGPLPAWAQDSFTAHMTLHMLIVAVAAPLLAAGLAGWRRADPVRAFPQLFSPLPASGVELITVWAWHVPALHQAARIHASVFALEQFTFLASGLLLWLSVLGGPARRRAIMALPGLAALALTLAHMTLLGVLLSLSPRPLYTHGAVLATALHDQQRGGAVMLAATGAVCVLGALVLGRRLVQAVARTGLEGA